MKVPTVSKDVWRNLYDSAIRFKKLRPWESLSDDRVFGVKDPLTGEVGYCCVLGELAQVLALCVYRGSAGLDIHQRMQSGEFDNNLDDSLGVQNCLMAEFTNRREVQKEDLAVMKGLGLSFRGHNAYPIFRSYLPAYCPWFLTEQEARFLTLALDCACDLTKLYRENPGMLTPQEPGRYLVYVPQEGKDVSAWTKSWQEPAPLPTNHGPDEPLDQTRLNKIEAMARMRDSAWEADFFFFPGSVQDRDRPYWMRLIMVAHRDSGFIFHMEALQPEADSGLSLQEGLLSTIEKTTLLPQELHIRHPDLMQVINPLADSLGFKLSLKKTLPAISQAKTAMRQAF